MNKIILKVVKDKQGHILKPYIRIDGELFEIPHMENFKIDVSATDLSKITFTCFLKTNDDESYKLYPVVDNPGEIS